MISIPQSPVFFHDLHQCVAEARAALRNAPYAGLRQVECRREGDSLVLTGSVPSFYLKQMAQCQLGKLWCGTVSVVNRLKVESEMSADLDPFRDSRTP